MKRPALTSRDTRALRLGAMLLAPVLAYALLVRPYVAALADARTRLADERSLLAREQELVREAPRFPQRRQRASVALGATWTRIVRGADTISIGASLNRYVSGAAESSGLLVEQVESRGADSLSMARLTSGGLTAASVELRARGDLERVLRFLSALESGETYARVDRLRIVRASPAGDAGDQETLTLTATITGIARVLARPAALYAAPGLPRPPREPAVASIERAAP